MIPPSFCKGKLVRELRSLMIPPSFCKGKLVRELRKGGKDASGIQLLAPRGCFTHLRRSSLRAPLCLRPYGLIDPSFYTDLQNYGKGSLLSSFAGSSLIFLVSFAAMFAATFSLEGLFSAPSWDCWCCFWWSLNWSLNCLFLSLKWCSSQNFCSFFC